MCSRSPCVCIYIFIQIYMLNSSTHHRVHVVYLNRNRWRVANRKKWKENNIHLVFVSFVCCWCAEPLTYTRMFSSVVSLSMWSILVVWMEQEKSNWRERGINTCSGTNKCTIQLHRYVWNKPFCKRPLHAFRLVSRKKFSERLLCE